MSAIATSGAAPRQMITAAPVSAPVFEAPFAQFGINSAYVLRQEFEQLCSPGNPWTPLALDTPHPDYGTYLLVSETPLQDRGVGGLVRWIRVYAQTPASFSRPSGSYVYTFPGIASATAGVARLPITRSVPATVQRDFFRTISPGSIVFIPAFRVYLVVSGGSTSYDADTVADSGALSPQTNPGAVVYTGYMATGFQIAPEASKLSVWMGNIYVRETTYIPAT